MSRIAVIGMWHLGPVTAACLARLGHSVVGIDTSSDVIEKLKKGKAPVLEPGLDKLLKENNVEFTTDFRAIKDCDVIYIAFDTKVDEDDMLDLGDINKSIDMVSGLIGKNAIIIISSQIPIGTSEKIIKKLGETGKNNELYYIPENLRLGQAIKTFMEPDRIIIGSRTRKAEKALGIFEKIGCRKIVTDLKSAEMVKHALNSYLGLMISFSGEISDLCEKTGADAKKVMELLKADSRVSSKAPINPGLPFGGGTLARDIQVLRAKGIEKKISTHILDAIMEANRGRMSYVRKRLEEKLGNLEGKKIAIFGLAYKAGTNTLRRSVALQMAGQLEGAEVIGYDPMIKKTDRIKTAFSAEEAAENAEAIVIMTDWPEFRKLDYARIAGKMKGKVILDAKNMLDKEKIKKAGLLYMGIGVGDE